MAASAEIVVERLRVRDGPDAVDPGVERLRFEQALDGGALRPPGLAPAAVLCIRHLVDPRPGTWRLRPGDRRPPPAWESACVAALEELRRGAARPAHEAVPANVEAVLFADEAEMMACLARDRIAAATWTRWWWRGVRSSLRGGRDPELAVWLERPEHAPAALELLATRGEAVSFAATMPTATAVDLAARVATAFAAPSLASAILEPEPRSRVGVLDSREQRDPPWQSIVADSGQASSPPEQQLMVGTLLAIRRSPTLTRSRTFAEQVLRWRAEGGGPAALAAIARDTAGSGTGTRR